MKVQCVVPKQLLTQIINLKKIKQMYISLIILMLISHFLFGWFQPRSIQNNKHKDTKVLVKHVFVNTFPFLLLSIIYFNSIYFAIVITILMYSAHYVCDYITSTLAKQAKDNKDEYKFIIIITAVDQLFHLSTYFILFYYGK